MNPLYLLKIVINKFDPLTDIDIDIGPKCHKLYSSVWD